MKLDNKTILVTGANRGIGAAIVRELLKHKVGKIYAAARNTKNLPDFGSSKVVPLTLDITNQAQVKAAAETAKDVNVLINNAGTASFGGVIDNSPEAITLDMNTNYYGTLNTVRAFAPVLQKNGQGLVANVISIVGLSAIPAVGSYSASKAALHGATQSLRAELAPRNIQVLGIYPGPIDTDMAKDFPMEKASAEETAKNIVAGLIAGESYIFPDTLSQQWGALWLKDPRALEQAFTAPAEEKAA